MSETTKNKLSRRDFAQRAMMLSATASLVPASIALETPINARVPGQSQPELPKLTPAGQAEVDGRMQQILNLSGVQFDEEQKALLKTLCMFLQPALDHVRAYKLDNGDSPAVYLKPLLEREKKPQPAHAPAAPKS